jgi:hypothetical protein
MISLQKQKTAASTCTVQCCALVDVLIPHARYVPSACRLAKRQQLQAERRNQKHAHPYDR